MPDKHAQVNNPDGPKTWENLFGLDKDIQVAIQNNLTKGNISFIGILGILEKHKMQVFDIAKQQDALRRQKAAMAKPAGAPAQ